MAKIPNPRGMTTTAGPGSTIMATPTIRTVTPTTATAILRTCFNESAVLIFSRKASIPEPGITSGLSLCSFLLG